MSAPLGAVPVEQRQAIRTYTDGKLSAIEYPCGCRASGGLLPLPDYCPQHGTVPVEHDEEPDWKEAYRAKSGMFRTQLREVARLEAELLTLRHQLAEVRALLAEMERVTDTAHEESKGGWYYIVKDWASRLRHVLEPKQG